MFQLSCNDFEAILLQNISIRSCKMHESALILHDTIYNSDESASLLENGDGPCPPDVKDSTYEFERARLERVQFQFFSLILIRNCAFRLCFLFFHVLQTVRVLG